MLELADSSALLTSTTGKVMIDTEYITIALLNVYYVPKMNLNILLSSRIHKYGDSTMIEKNKCNVLNRENRQRVLGTIER